MAFGLRVKDASGNVHLDLSRRLGRILGFTDTGAANSGSVTDANLALGNPFFFSVPLSAAVTYFSPQISFSGTTLNWAWTNTIYQTSSRIFYGIC